MRLYTYFLLLTLLLASCTEPRGFNEEEEIKKIIDLHNQQRDFHFLKDSIGFANLMSENFISVNRGIISRPTIGENISRYNRYFSSVEFEKWDDMSDPIIRFSKDGSLAYTIVDKVVAITYQDESGNFKSGETQFAWTAIYRRYGNEWKIDCVTSTERPDERHKRDYIINEKDLIPEGVAYNPKTKAIYVGSIYKQKIISILPNGEKVDIITQEDFGELSPIGMEVDSARDMLWVNVALAPIVNKTGMTQWRTTMMCFGLTDNQLIKKYDLIQKDKAFLNDLTVTSKGDVYATESANGYVYKLDSKKNILEPFMDLSEFGFPNGIIYHKPMNAIFVATNRGIVKIDLVNKEASLLIVPPDIDTKSIDGLAIYHDFFIGHQSTKVSKFYFSENMDSIVRYEILDSGDEFDSSTTGEIGDGSYHYIVNSQIRSGIYKEKNEIKPYDSLENVIIRSIKL